MKKLFNLFKSDANFQQQQEKPVLNTTEPPPPPAPSRPEMPPKHFDTAKEKAHKLVDKYYFCYSTITKDMAKKLAQITIDEIEKELTEFGEWSHELQNMEQEFRHLNNVRDEIYKL